METLNESLKLTLIPTSLVWSKVSVMLDSTTGPASLSERITKILINRLNYSYALTLTPYTCIVTTHIVS